ncbi:MAG: nucleotide exchange factor GrpE [Defluviitaleaceae bacterium]|nr:nucleotide exchange factor GrpE [Defluviitaleaceae bacterium]
MSKYEIESNKAEYKKPEQALTLMEKHNKVYLRCLRFVSTTASIALRLLVEASFNELYTSSFSGTRFYMQGGYLESYYSKVMDGYSNILNYYNLHESDIDPHEKATLASIRTIFYTRLSEYKNILPDSSNFEAREVSNAYLQSFSEKIREIMLVKFNNTLKEIQNNYTANMWNITEVSSKDITEDVKSDIIREFSEDFFNIYKEFSSHAKVLDEKAKDVVLLNFERIKQEYNILKAIVRVQAPKFETQGKDYGPVNRILEMIQSEYERLGYDIDHTEKLYNQAMQEIYASGGDFYRFIDSILVCINSKDDLIQNMDKFLCEYVFILDEYDEEVKAYWRDEFNENPDMLKPHDTLRTEALFSGIMKEFDTVYRSISENMEDCKDDTGIYQIISGIYETIAVKQGSMNEMFEEYLENLKPFLGKESYQGYDFEQNIEKALEEYKLNFNDFFDNEGCAKLIDDFYKSQMENAKERNLISIEKSWESESGNIEKAGNKFKKECLFFEIITFEEIISYSVLKLKDSENEIALKCSKIIEDAAINIKKLIMEYGIEVIEPSLGEIFNGRLHEVIMAKEEDGFVRGEITKVVSNGYREGDVIFARANVICAK